MSDTTTTIAQYRNLETGEIAPAHRVGTDGDGDPVYNVPEGWEPVEPYWLDEDGLAHALARTCNDEAGDVIHDAVWRVLAAHPQWRGTSPAHGSPHGAATSALVQYLRAYGKDPAQLSQAAHRVSAVLGSYADPAMSACVYAAFGVSDSDAFAGAAEVSR